MIIYLFTLRKILRCIIVSSLSLVDISNEFQEKIKISYNNKHVKNLSSTIVKIKNSSTSYLDDSNFINPIQLIFDDSIELLEYEILERSNPDRETKILIDKNRAFFEKITLLNRFDSIIVRFIHHGIPNNKKPKINSDIKDFKLIQKEGIIASENESLFMLIDGIFLSFISSILLLIGIGSTFVLNIYSNVNSFTINITLIMIIIIILSSIFILIRGIKKIYQYITSVIVIKNKGAIQDE